MTAPTMAQRHDAQIALNRRPRTLEDAGRRITAEHTAMRNLLQVADDEVRWGNGSPALRAAVAAVKEVRS